MSIKYNIDLCREVAGLNLPIMEIACGPGLGLLPDICALNSATVALATDACPILIEKWHEFFAQNNITNHISFASFNVAQMPIRSNSVDVITSNIGFSSLRYAGNDNMLGIIEAYRVLKPGGYVYTIENEFEDLILIQKVFDLCGKENWFKNNKLSWTQRFETAGFIIEYEKDHLRRIEKEDWELGEFAYKNGIEIAVKFKAYKLIKRKV